jgi:hypothetical protein
MKAIALVVLCASSVLAASCQSAGKNSPNPIPATPANGVTPKEIQKLEQQLDSFDRELPGRTREDFANSDRRKELLKAFTPPFSKPIETIRPEPINVIPERRLPSVLPYDR